MNELGLRFWDKVDLSGECWEWVAARTQHGYGAYWLDGTMRRAHRLSYESLVGPIPDGLTLDHLCRNRACVNPAHLEPVANSVNVLRGDGPTALNARKDECVRGHEFTQENTIVRAERWRECRTCTNARQRAWKVRVKEEARHGEG